MTRKTSFTLALFLILAAAFCPGGMALARQEVYLSISKQANPKMKVIVAPFTQRAQDNSLRKLLLKDLEFSGVVETIAEGELLATAEETDRRAGRILFANWGRFGAQALVKIEDTSSGAQCNVQMTAYAMQDQSRLLAKHYKVPAADKKKMIHTMVNDLIFALTGTEGIMRTRIAFVSDATGTKELYVMDFDGDNERRLSSDRSLFLYPRWSPDGKDLVAVSYLRNKPMICRVTLASGARSFVSAFPGLNAGASYSPDGKSLALTLSKDGNPEIYRLSLEDGHATRLTNDRAVDSSPTWSPDGKEIAFISDRSGTPQIYKMNANGSNPRRVSFQGSYNTSPAWSPKGNFIAYCTLLGRTFQIVVLELASGTAYQITNDDRSNEDPSWAPDGRHLVYSSSKNYKSDLFMIDIYDQHPIQLTHRLGNCVSPGWSRNFSN